MEYDVIDRGNFPDHLEEACRQWADWTVSFDDPDMSDNTPAEAYLSSDYIIEALPLGITTTDEGDDRPETIHVTRLGLNDELHWVTLIYMHRGNQTVLLAVEADTYWSTVPTEPEPDNRHYDECPEHGLQEVTGYGSTQGPDPYAVNELACGHNVICMGPGSPNEIIHTRRNMNKEL